MKTVLMFVSARDTARNAKIDGSGLTEIIKQTFTDLTLPQGIDGCIRLFQRHNNPDSFGLYFDSSSESDAYRRGDAYTFPGIATFGRSDFEDFPSREHHFRQRIQEFARLLTCGQLERADFA